MTIMLHDNHGDKITVRQVKNAREQAKCGGHRHVSVEQYCEHVDCLLAEIERLQNELENQTLARQTR